MTTVAVLGLGAMGGRIARRLVQTGHEVVVWNRTAARTAPLVELGARAADSPAEATRAAQVVLTMVADPEALIAVTEGTDGVASASGRGTTVIEMSTVGPAAIGRLRSVLPDEAGLLDAPVLGSLGEAESGTLLVFVGGPADLARRWTPLLSDLGSPIPVGPLGTGASAKLVANATLVGTLALLGEVIALADGLGVPRETAFRLLAATPLAAQAERRRPSLETGGFPLRFSLSLARKDAELIAAAVEDAGVDARVLGAAARWFVEADEAGLGDRDYSEVLTRIIQRAERDGGGC